jgi:uncharacterized protein with HEPN domain
MKPDDRVAGLLDDLDETLRSAAALVARGRAAFDEDVAIRLAFEALSNRVGEIAKRLVQIDPGLFTEPMWSLAARNRDKLVHHYQLIDHEVLWSTVARSFPELAVLGH